MDFDWSKYKKFLPYGGVTKCPICNEEITESTKDITYSKTRGGTHLFIHVKCLRKGGKNG